MAASLTWTELLTLLALLAPAAYLLVSYVVARGGPPTVSYWIPWVGSALAIRQDPDKFFDWAANKYGPLFRVRALGKDTLYAISPNLIDEIHRDNETYDHAPFRSDILHQAFGIPAEVAHHPSMSNHMRHQMLFPNADPDIMQRYTVHAHRALHAMLLDVPKRTGRMRLRGLLAPAYIASSRTLLGARYDALACFGAFQEFDRTFPTLAEGASELQARGAWAQVVRSIEEHIATPGNLEDAASAVRESMNEWRRECFDNHVIAELLAADLWAASANTIWAVYWVVALHLQTRKERLGILRAEVDGSRTSWAAAHSSRTPIAEDPAALHTWLVNSTDSTPLLNSAIQETLRFASSAASTRVVIRDTILAGYRLLKGDRIVCLTRVSHMDEEIHEWADQYEPARYMNANVVRIKDGEFVTNHTMPFGGGASMCPGRHLAQAQIRAFVALALTLMEIRLDEKSHMKVEMDMLRIGLGVLHAKGDVDIFASPRSL